MMRHQKHRTRYEQLLRQESHRAGATADSSHMSDSMEMENQKTDRLPIDDETKDIGLHVQALLQQVQDRFQSMSDQILSRIDQMGSRIDDLERNLNDLMANAGIPPEAAPGASGPQPK